MSPYLVLIEEDFIRFTKILLFIHLPNFDANIWWILT